MNEMRMIDESVPILYIGDMVCVHSLILFLNSRLVRTSKEMGIPLVYLQDTVYLLGVSGAPILFI